MIVGTVAIVETAVALAAAEETGEIVEIVETVVAKAQVQVAKQAVTGVEIGSARNATPTTLQDELSASSVARRSLKGDVADKLRTLPLLAPLSSEDSCH